ncbi:MAG TPA: HAD hydrolase-like protein [Chitinophagaceae bacterium]|nr:HAD hydrolase-like protein [Chitinophagaceae bacterium]
MNPKIVVSDFDGVLGNSLPTAINIVREIVRLFDKSESVNSFEDYRRLLGKQTTLRGVSPEQTETLRELHRIVMEHRGHEIKLFSGVLRVYSQLKHKPFISSSSYSGTIKKALGEYTDAFEAVHGFDSGKKEDVLAKLKSDMDFIYITDSKVDIKRCRQVGVPVIATGWGYDAVETLQNAEPDFFAADCMELKTILKNLNLI